MTKSIKSQKLKNGSITLECTTDWSYDDDIRYFSVVIDYKEVRYSESHKKLSAGLIAYDRILKELEEQENEN